ncbi:MAG: bifunctional aspartate kinase/diaminopimelate decarboxylase [Thermoanaerobaculia bacterium]|nr:bifunctional aspartate kinase/diaminopimelate decarboxylase [Thermoanaerobaculia bacterium]
MTNSDRRWRILKFGGRSTETPEDWKAIVQVLRDRLGEGTRPLVILAAQRGVTRRIDNTIERAIRGQIDPDVEQIRIDHLERARSLRAGVDDAQFLREEIEQLRAGLSEIVQAGKASPRERASLLALGERMMIRLGTAILRSEGLSVASVEADGILRVRTAPEISEARRYLRARCTARIDEDLIEELGRIEADVIVTEGFIAANDQSETVLLGWGGSDASAACLAVKLDADRAELWKDVPGLFTTDPRIVPSARLLRTVDYDEAEEMATSGAEIIHPAAIAPLRDASIPLEIRSIRKPDAEHTVIGDRAVRGAQVKAISSRRGITLISIDTTRMWHEVGFLARIFEVLAGYDLSIDLVTTSETNVTVSLDPVSDLEPAVIGKAVQALRSFCKAETIKPCAIVSLIGRDLRKILPELSPALTALDEQPVHLISQSASDVDFTFVVDEQYADRVVRRLHATFFDHQPIDDIFGPSWSALMRSTEGTDSRIAVDSWWSARQAELLSIASRTSPVYVYDQRTLRRQAERLTALSPISRVFYAIKANENPDVLRVFERAGIGFECVSPGEIDHVRSTFPDLATDRILFTPNFAAKSDYESALARNVWVTLDNLHPLEKWPDLFKGRSILLRIDPGQGHGHHKHVRTAGMHSKFGIAPQELPALSRLLSEKGIRVVGLHAHVGSGVKRPTAWIETARTLASHLELFPEVQIVNVGGGLGVVERPGDSALDLEAMSSTLERFRSEHPGIELWIEPGRFLVSEAGVLLTTVTQLKRKGPVRYVGVDAGFNSLLRPALYGSYHEIVNLSRLHEPPVIVAEVVGPICDTGDVLGHGRALPETEEGDVLLIATAGAYGRVMASDYNLRPPAGEVFLEEGTEGRRAEEAGGQKPIG